MINDVDLKVSILSFTASSGRRISFDTRDIPSIEAAISMFKAVEKSCDHNPPKTNLAPMSLNKALRLQDFFDSQPKRNSEF